MTPRRRTCDSYSGKSTTCDTECPDGHDDGRSTDVRSPPTVFCGPRPRGKRHPGQFRHSHRRALRMNFVSTHAVLPLCPGPSAVQFRHGPSGPRGDRRGRTGPHSPVLPDGSCGSVGGNPEACGHGTIIASLSGHAGVLLLGPVHGPLTPRCSQTPQIALWAIASHTSRNTLRISPGRTTAP